PVLFAYRIKRLRITNQTPYKLVYGKDPHLVMDNMDTQGSTIIERLLEITNKVPQLREMARRSIKEIQDKLNQKFGEQKERQFQKGELVWYFDKAKAARHDTKLEPKWKGPYQIVLALDKGAYKISLDGKI